MQYIFCFAKSIGDVEYAWVVAMDVTDVPRTAVVRTAIRASAVFPSSVRPSSVRLSSVRPTSVVEEFENLWTCELVVMSVIYFELVNLRTWELKNLWTCSDVRHCIWALLWYIYDVCDVCYQLWILYVIFVCTDNFIRQKQKKRFSVWSLCRVP